MVSFLLMKEIKKIDDIPIRCDFFYCYWNKKLCGFDFYVKALKIHHLSLIWLVRFKEKLIFIDEAIQLKTLCKTDKLNFELIFIECVGGCVCVYVCMGSAATMSFQEYVWNRISQSVIHTHRRSNCIYF